MKVQFLVDYRGVLTKNPNGIEQYHQKGEKIDLGADGFEDYDGPELVKAGRAKKIGASKKAA